MLAVTFTNKAAEEMRARVETLLGADCSQMWVSTFHSLVRPLPAPRGAGDRSVARFRDLRFVRSADGRQAGAEGAAASTTASFSPARRRRASVRPRTGWKGRTRLPRAAGWNRRDEHIAKIYELLRERAEGRAALDFDDLLLKTVELFETVRARSQQLLEQFRFVHGRRVSGHRIARSIC